MTLYRPSRLESSEGWEVRRHRFVTITLHMKPSVPLTPERRMLHLYKIGSNKVESLASEIGTPFGVLVSPFSSVVRCATE